MLDLPATTADLLFRVERDLVAGAGDEWDPFGAGVAPATAGVGDPSTEPASSTTGVESRPPFSGLARHSNNPRCRPALFAAHQYWLRPLRVGVALADVLDSFVRGAGPDAATLGNCAAALDSFLAVRIGRVFGSALVGLGPTAALSSALGHHRGHGSADFLGRSFFRRRRFGAAAGARSTIPADCVGTSTIGPVSSPEAISFTGLVLLLDEI